MDCADGGGRGDASRDRGIRVHAETCPHYLFLTEEHYEHADFEVRSTIAVGSDADIVVFDPNERCTIEAAKQHRRVDYSMFEGGSVTGRVRKVFLRGDMIVDGERWLGRECGGSYIARGEAGRLW